MSSLVWMYSHGPSKKLSSILVIYRVIGVGSNYISVRQLSQCPSLLYGTPEAEGRLRPNTHVLGLSLNSIEKMRHVFSSPAMQANGFRLAFPTQTRAVKEHQRLTETPRVIFDLDEDVDVDCLGPVVSSSSAAGAAPIPPPAAAPAPQPSATAPGEKALADAVKELAKSKSGVETKKTVGAYLREEPAAVLSTEPSVLLKQGNLEVLNRMCLSHLAPSNSPAEPTRAAFWGLQNRPFRTQLQPAHLIMMLQSMVSVDIRMFSDLFQPLGPHLSEGVVQRCSQSDALTADAAISTYLHTIGTDQARFEHAVRNFGFVVDNLLLLCSPIREAIKAMLDRFIRHAQSMLLDPTNVVTALLYVFWAYEFQSAVSRMYAMIQSKVLDGVDKVVAYLAPIPNTTDQFQPFLASQLHIMHHSKFPTHISLTPPTPPTPATSILPGTSPIQPTSLGLGAGGGGGGGSGRGGRGGGRGKGRDGRGGRGGDGQQLRICAYYITKSRDGKTDACRQQNCTRPHTQYTEAMANQPWLQEFLTRTRRTLDPARKA